MAILNRFALAIACLTVSLYADFQLKKRDVRQTFDEMLHLHVEHDELDAPLLERAFKLFIDRFDASKMYLTLFEVQMIEKLILRCSEAGVKAYYADDLKYFEQINHYLSRALTRAREWRKEMERELILSALDLEPIQGEAYLSYAKNEESLKDRMRKQLIRILLQEKALNALESWTPKDREKIFSMWEGRFLTREKEYLASNERGEHYLVLHTLKALGLSLDAHTVYFSPDEALEMRTSLEKQFEGVGVVLREGVYGVIIVDLIDGGPAKKSGKVEVGDQIIAIGERPAEKMTYSEILDAMKGRRGEELHLTLRRRGSGQVEKVSLVREKVMMSDGRLKVEAISHEDGQIGILTLPSFYEGSHATSAEGDMREAIQKLKRKGPINGMILDLRENAGGFLTQAVKVSGLFMSKGVVVISKYARGAIKYLRNLDGRLQYDGPLVILTSRASASAAEIVAQALQDYGIALIVGDEETYGKGTIQYQTVTDKNAKAFYKVTVGRYYTVSGRSTQIEGVKADIVVPTIFSSYKIGERFLEHPLSNDRVAAAFIDPLSDIDYKNRNWFQKNYLPGLHQREEKWLKMLPELRKNSELRLQKDENFSLFLTAQEKLKGSSSRSFRRVANPPWGDEDLQMVEAVHIMRDMIKSSQNP